MLVQATFPKIMKFGGGVSRDIGSLLQQLGLARPLIVTDRFLMDSGHASQILDDLAASGFHARVFADTVPEPTVASIENALQFLAEGNHDCVIGFGGGSPMDSAKVLAVLAMHGGSIRAYKTPHIQDLAGLPIIAIPTTAGTGSEATRFAVVTDETNDEKMLCAGLAYLPVAALIDYRLTISMPPRLTADTGLDALTHAIEAFVSKRATPWSDMFALAALRCIAPNLRQACRVPDDEAAREAMMFGATQAGIAFSNSSVALVHGMSRPIGAHFHVPHGLSNAMLLPTVTRFSGPSSLERYAECARVMGVAPLDKGNQWAVSKLISELESLNSDLDVPTPERFGIDRSRWESLLPTMAEQALASGSPGNNPLVPNAEEIQMLYRRAWAYNPEIKG